MKRRFIIVKHFVPIFLMLLLIVPFLLGGCGGSSNDDDEDPLQPPLSGVFADSPVSGLNYETATLSGVTDSNGTFQYADGETVTFSIGDLDIGSALGAEMLSPVDIVDGATDPSDARVTNLCVLLQTIDQDGSLNNGIQITPEIAEIISSNSTGIDFDLSPDAFAENADVVMLIAELNDAGLFTDIDPRERRLVGAATAQGHLKRSLSPRNTVQTGYGLLRGYAPDDHTWQYLGIPYAEPPIGDLRWRAPRPPEAWDGVRQATDWGDQAAQNPRYEAFAFGGMSEDCLYLNVTAPKNAADLPVMVWFHGGGFVILTGNTAGYNNPASLPTKDVVLVTVNHRLGPFGYLAHPLLSAESGYGASGNYGQMDLIAALEWVRDNISAFGGDPNNVTIFGESGGGGKSISLMASPLAEGLFDKVICESGMAHSSIGVLNGMPLAEAEAFGTDLSNRLGATTLEELRDKSWMEIIEAELIAYNGDYKDVYGPVIDGRYMTDTLGNLIQAGQANDVPLMAGINSADMAGLGIGMQEQMPWRSDNNTAPQFAYYFSYVPALWAAQGVGAYHGIELVYVFNNPDSFLNHYLFGLTGIDEDPQTEEAEVSPNGFLANPPGYGAEDITLTEQVMTIWTNFARTGDPSIAGVVDWTPYTTENDAYLEIATTLQMLTGFSQLSVE